jgi:cell division protein ZapA (FtsZ GTPase activity inhibitor)
MAKSRIKVDLLGTSFHVHAEEESDYLATVVSYLREKVEEVRREATMADPVKIALLAGLNLVDELFKERSRRGGSVSDPEIGRITERLIETIDRSLGD